MRQFSIIRGLLTGLIVCALVAYAKSHEFDTNSDFQFASGEFDSDECGEDPENEFNNCKIDCDDANKYPWLGYLRISNDTDTEETEHDWYWPVMIIGPTTVLTGAGAFRSPYSDRKLKVLDPEFYHVTLKDREHRNVSSIQFNPGIAARAQHWMKVDNDFALIHLTEAINFTSQVRPLCLPTWTHMNESIIEAGSTGIMSGWHCNYHNALRRNNTSIHLQVNTTEACTKVWRSQADYSEKEGTKYKHRICGKPTSRNAQTLDPEDGGLCADKFYFHIHTRNENERVLSGIFNAIAHEVYNGPTAYVLLLNPSTIKWINDSMKCDSDKFTCHSGECIDRDSICDQDKDCPDGSDEEPIYCRARRYCTESEYECGTYGECANKESVTECDGIADCVDGEDEEKCPTTTTSKTSSSQTNLKWWVYVTSLLLSLVICVGAALIGYEKVTKRKERLYLTAKEILEFRQGITTDCGWVNDNFTCEFIGVGESPGLESPGTDAQCQLNSMQMPYIYNIDRDQLKFCEEIGEGAFGVVRKGIVAGKTVAIKVLKSDAVNKEMFKTFLVEVKILAFINFIKGGHQNVIRLVGAYTEEIRNFQLFIVVEYCQFGSIADYLRDHRQQFRHNSIDATETSPSPSLGKIPSCSYVAATSLQASFGIQTLHAWTLQIVDGMHFLATHKIFHGDLAARNVLLDFNLTAKISDFGLSRQMYHYKTSSAKVYKNTQLPWMWMAPEVLGTMKISSKSDVWSFGVTLWELYELGNVPYGGLAWNPYFVEQLKCGLRLPKPQYANDELFAVIRDCWSYAADERPDFETLRNILCSLSWTDLDLHLFSY